MYSLDMASSLYQRNNGFNFASDKVAKETKKFTSCLQPQSGVSNDLHLSSYRSLVSKIGNGIAIFHHISCLIRMVGQMTG